ncbi:MAG: hypothetical protein ABJX82_04230, partial [Paracoccaceae bacterium]
AKADFFGGINGHFYHDEVKDFLSGEMRGKRVYPSRFQESEKEAAHKKNFVKSLRKSYTLDQTETTSSCIITKQGLRTGRRMASGEACSVGRSWLRRRRPCMS